MYCENIYTQRTIQFKGIEQYRLVFIGKDEQIEPKKSWIEKYKKKVFTKLRVEDYIIGTWLNAYLHTIELVLTNTFRFIKVYCAQSVVKGFAVKQSDFEKDRQKKRLSFWSTLYIL